MRKNEKIRCEKGKFEKKKKITWRVIHGAHISLFGGEGSFLPPPYVHLKT